MRPADSQYHAVSVIKSLQQFAQTSASNPGENLLEGFPVGPEAALVTGLPCTPKLGVAQVPIWTDLFRHLAQVVVQVRNGGPSPVPIAVIDTVDRQSRL